MALRTSRRVQTSRARVEGIGRRGAATALAVILAATAVFTGCGGDDDDSGDSAEGPREEVTILLGFQESINWLPLLIARDQGYFEDEGIEPVVETTEGGGFVVQQVIAGNVPFGWAGGDSMIVGAAQDPDVRAVMCDHQRNIFQIVTLAGSDFGSVEDLDGEALGISAKGGGEEPMVNSVLDEFGLKDSVEVIPIGEAGPQSQQAIQSEQVAAYASSFPDIASLEAGGLEFEDITPERYENTVAADCLMTTQDALEDAGEREQLVAMARAWMKGLIFSDENQEASLRIACEQVPEECEDMDFARSFLESNVELFQPVDPSLLLGSLDPATWSNTAEILAEQGTLEGEVDIDLLIGGGELAEVQEEIRDFDEDEIREQARSAE